MPGGLNLASKYLDAVDERFVSESQSLLAFNNKFDFTGDKTVNIYSVSVAPLNDYTRSGSSRYGTPDDLSRNVQTMTVKRDRSFTYIIDRGDLVQSEMVMQSGESLAREIREVVVPEFDQYVFRTIAAAAKEAGSYSSTSITTSNAYSEFLNAMQFLGDHNVPENGRVCFASYAFVNKLKLDPAFMAYGDRAQDMKLRGVIGECDGCRIVQVASRQLPQGTAFLLCHKDAATAPRQLEEYREHIDPPGISGVLAEGRILYDCFVFNEKTDAIYFHTGCGGLKGIVLFVTTAGGGKIRLIVNGMKDDDANKRYVAMASAKASLPAVTEGTAIDPTDSTDPWYGSTLLTSATTELTPSTGDKYLRVVEIENGTGLPVSVETKKFA